MYFSQLPGQSREDRKEKTVVAQSETRIEQREHGNVQVIARAAEILRALIDQPDGLSLSQIAKKVGLARSTVHRIVIALEAEHFVIPTSPSGRIRLGPGLLHLAAQDFITKRGEIANVDVIRVNDELIGTHVAQVIAYQ